MGEAYSAFRAAFPFLSQRIMHGFWQEEAKSSTVSFSSM
jgi:hypothetical protein